MLCDGDCGNCYNEKEMNLTCYPPLNLCKECMFNFMAEQEHEDNE